jgi:hypothetical protein
VPELAAEQAQSTLVVLLYYNLIEFVSSSTGHDRKRMNGRLMVEKLTRRHTRSDGRSTFSLNVKPEIARNQQPVLVSCENVIVAS